MAEESTKYIYLSDMGCKFPDCDCKVPDHAFSQEVRRKYCKLTSEEKCIILKV